MQSTLTCPQCGEAMNHHASKILHSGENLAGEAEALLDIHTCPGCGASESSSG